MTKHTPIGTPTTVAASQIFVAPENPRSSQIIVTERIQELADNIEDLGLLSPLIGYEENGDFYVTAGGRRTLAITSLLVQDRMAPETPIPVVLMQKTAAVVAGHAEQLSHVGMTDLDELRVYMHPAYATLSDSELAKRLVKSVRAIKQRRAVSDLPQEIKDAAFDGTITVEQAFGLTYFLDDEEGLSDMFEACVSNRHIDLEDCRRRAVSRVSTWQSNSLTNLVTREQYLEAGGVLQEDLFAEATIIKSPGLLENLARESAQAHLEAEYPGQAVFYTDHVNWQNLHPGQNELTEDEAEEWDDIRYEKYMHDRDTEMDWFERYDELEAKAKPFWSPELEAMLEVHFSLNPSAEDPIRVFAHVIPEDREPLYEAGYLERPQEVAESGGDASEVEGDEPTSPALSSALASAIVNIKLHAARMELASKPNDVIGFYLAHLGNSRSRAFDYTPQNTLFLDESEASRSKKAEEYTDMLVMEREQILALSPADQRGLLAYRIMLCATPQFDTSFYVGSVRKYWTPDADFLKRYKKVGVIDMLIAAGFNDSDGLAKLKLSALADRLAQHAADHKDWLPDGFTQT